MKDWLGRGRGQQGLGTVSVDDVYRGEASLSNFRE